MKISNHLSSFRVKIIITLFVLISSFSFLSFHIYNIYLTKRIYSNAEEHILSIMNFIRDEINSIHNGRMIKPLLRNLQNDKQLFQTYLFDYEGNIKHTQYPDSIFDEIAIKRSLNFDELIARDEEVYVSTIMFDNHPVTRAFLRVKNSPVCFTCHSSELKTLGYLVMDFSMKETQANINFTRNFTIFFTLLMVALISALVFALHYKFVIKSLIRFNQSIARINEGDLTERVIIPESKELGHLGACFNRMIDNFERTQNELHFYHQKELQDANRLATIGEMAARLAHEVRNPLMGIANSIEIIVGEMADSPNKSILEEIKRQANRVNTAISNLLKYTRSTEIKIGSGNINELLKNVVFFLKNQKQNSGINFVLVLHDDIPEFKFDSEQIENVVLNLGINAIQAMNGKGTITFRSVYNPESSLVEISVEDSGKGIPPDKSADVFKPFFTTKTEGTGLGLAISKDIIEKHSGKIWFENKENEGCVFTMSLPVEPVKS